jgi:hypothetical protein
MTWQNDYKQIITKHWFLKDTYHYLTRAQIKKQASKQEQAVYL